MKKRMIALLLAALMICSLTACGGNTGSKSESAAASSSKAESSAAAEEKKAEPAEAGQPYEIVMLAKSIATDNWQMFFAGCKAAAAEIGEDKVTLTLDGTDNPNAYEDQLNMIENYISGGCDAISVAPCSSDSVIPTLTEAYNNGVVVGITDTAVNFEAYNNFTAFDNYNAGQTAAEAMIEDLTGKQIDYNGKKVIMICPVPGVQTLDDRMAGFTDKMSEIAPEIEIVDPYYCEGDNNKALSNAQDAWQAYGDEIVGMYGLDEGVCDAISRCMDENSLQGAFSIIGIDATTLACADVEKGNVYAVIGMSMYDMGYTATMNMYKALCGDEVEKDTQLASVIVNKDNMNDEEIRRVWDITALQ